MVRLFSYLLVMGKLLIQLFPRTQARVTNLNFPPNLKPTQLDQLSRHLLNLYWLPHI